MINLSTKQDEVFNSIMQWYKTDQPTFTLAGYAGTGKTTLARFIAKEIEKVHFCAFTGKAASVLRDKGCKGATTIHGAIYKLVSDTKKDLEFVFEPSPQITAADLVIVDEYSMLTPELIEDLERACTRILYLGDPFQLPPIGNENKIHPDLFIEEIHRQALDSPIIRFATGIREGKRLKYGNSGEFIYQPQSKIPKEWFYEVDQLIVGYNRTRSKWNARYREEKGFIEELPEKGDKLICLRNDRKKGLFNGMIGYTKKDSRTVTGDRVLVDFEHWTDLLVWDGNFLNKKEVPKGINHLNRFDYAYAITCHKSQGSEFDSILVCNQPIGKTSEDRARWLYTAVTRAKRKCILMEPKR